MKTLALISLLLSLGFSNSSAEPKKGWSPPSIPDVLNAIQSDDKAGASHLIRSSFNSATLAKGKHWVDETTIMWMAESTSPVSIYLKGTGELITKLTQLDKKGLQAAIKNVGNQVDFHYEMKQEEGPDFKGGNIKIEFYPYPKESNFISDVPRGSITRHTFNESKIYPTTNRELEVYIPSQYTPGTPVSLIVFQDGLRHAELDSKAGLRAPVVMDNLIAAGDMPVTVGIFINPGSDKNQEGGKPKNRSFEYDSLGNTYVNFLLTEVIPFVEKEHGITFSDDPAHRAIAGGSSGCACAWTAAWESPDKFGKVLGWVGTFVDIRGAHAYPPMIRKNDRKPIRTALLGEKQDLDNQYGNWPLANQQMELALQYKDYDYKYWWGNGFHGSRHAAVMLPEMLRWLWADVKP